MVWNSLFWVNQIKVSFMPAIDFFARCMEAKVLPAFDSITEEANEIEREAFENPDRYIDPEYYDPADAAEDAFERGLEHYQWMKDMLQGTINLFTAGLYHLFEQQLLLFHRQELLTSDESKNTKLLNPKAAKAKLSEHGIVVESFASWSKIEELRLVANVAKHADGSSAHELRTKRPDLFTRSAGPLAMGTIAGPVFTPLTGQSLYVSQTEFRRYVDSVRSFWTEMCAALELQAANQ